KAAKKSWNHKSKEKSLTAENAETDEEFAEKIETITVKSNAIAEGKTIIAEALHGRGRPCLHNRIAQRSQRLKAFLRVLGVFCGFLCVLPPTSFPGRRTSSRRPCRLRPPSAWCVESGA